jgi:hypothetical protein
MADKDEVINAGDEKKDDKTPVSFASQEELDKLIDKVYSRAFEKANKIADEKFANVQKELDELKKPKAEEKKVDEKPEDKKKKGGKDDGSPDTETILARLDEVSKIADELRKEKDAAEQRAVEIERRTKDGQVKEQFFRVADKVGNAVGNGFFDNNDVFDLVKGDLDIDEDGNVVIINLKTKQPRVTTSGNLTLEQFLTDFAKTKSHMVRAKNSDGGSGGGESRKTDTKDKTEVVDYAKMPKEDFRTFTNNVMARQYTERK